MCPRDPITVRLVYGRGAMNASHTPPQRPEGAPRLTACSLCAGETLGGADPLPGGQRARLDRLQSEGVARVTYVECLDECERGDVVVARPGRAQRDRGAGPVWFERLAGDALTCELERWLRDGGPGAAGVPSPLAGLVIERAGEPDTGGEQDTDVVEGGPVDGGGPQAGR